MHLMTTAPATYLEVRAEEQLELAERAVHPAAVKAHYLLAELYLDALYGGGEHCREPQGQAELAKSR